MTLFHIYIIISISFGLVGAVQFKDFLYKDPTCKNINIYLVYISGFMVLGIGWPVYIANKIAKGIL